MGWQGMANDDGDDSEHEPEGVKQEVLKKEKKSSSHARIIRIAEKKLTRPVNIEPIETTGTSAKRFTAAIWETDPTPLRGVWVSKRRRRVVLNTSGHHKLAKATTSKARARKEAIENFTSHLSTKSLNLELEKKLVVLEERLQRTGLELIKSRKVLEAAKKLQDMRAGQEKYAKAESELFATLDA
ncbi:hypothetical protein LTR09_001746 [Extremus antarcticus]|uniref:Uncharacterized protein n=1 Tax=Extremus antarcticus TaxID=702011 RepID=A0AAJ0GHB0_9PEZI|nr:hypothetical protein LTR09_001746 [Extremus antarcticus]